MDKKQAKFYCENCSEEVKQNDKFCKKCGRFFSNVRCPKCGKIGSSNSFSNGCPSCGYGDKSKSQSITYIPNAKGHFYFHKKHSRNSISQTEKNAKKK